MFNSQRLTLILLSGIAFLGLARLLTLQVYSAAPTQSLPLTLTTTPISSIATAHSPTRTRAPSSTALLTPSHTPSPQFTLTPLSTETRRPSPTRYTLTDEQASDLELAQFVMNRHLPQYAWQARNESFDFVREDIDIDGDGRPETIIHGSHWYKTDFVAVLSYDSNKRAWHELAYAEESGHYCIESKYSVTPPFLIADFLSCGGGTGIFNQDWFQHWIKCDKDKCRDVWSAQIFDWSQGINDTMGVNYTTTTIERPNPQEIRLTRERFAIEGITKRNVVEEFGVVGETARRIVGPTEQFLYKWDGEVYKLVSGVQTTPGIEITREFDENIAKTSVLIGDSLRKLDLAFDVASNKFWGTTNNNTNQNFSPKGWVFPQAAVTNTDDGVRVAAVIGSDNGTRCRLNVQHYQFERFEVIQRLDLPCVPNFTRLFWEDIDEDGVAELLFLTLANGENDGPGIEQLRIYRVGDRLTELANVNGKINGTDGRGIRWEFVDNNFLLYAGLTPSDYQCWTFSCISFERRWQTYRWDVETNTLELVNQP